MSSQQTLSVIAHHSVPTTGMLWYTLNPLLVHVSTQTMSLVYEYDTVLHIRSAPIKLIMIFILSDQVAFITKYETTFN